MPFYLFYNCVEGSWERVRQKEDPSLVFGQQAPSDIAAVHITSAPNKGKDIGGKLVMMDAYLRSGVKTDFILLLHDKQSPYHVHRARWRADLLRIVEPQYLKTILQAFDSDPHTGIVASENAISNEWDNERLSNVYTNSPFIESLKEAYGIKPPGLQYVAGTMFWVRASLFEEFFCNYAPLEIRQRLEPGNIDDQAATHTHAWERLLCWLVTARGYRIKGI